MYPLQAIALAVENHAQGVLMRQLLVGPVFLIDQGLTHRFGRQAGVLESALKLRIGLAVRFHQRENILQQLGLNLFALAPTTLRKIVDSGDSGAQLVQTQGERFTGPTKDDLRLARTPPEVVQGYLRLKLPPLRPGQLSRGVAYHLNHNIRQLCLSFFHGYLLVG